MSGKTLFPPGPARLSNLFSHSGLVGSLVLSALVIGFAAPFFDVPLQRDQGVYAACGSILLHGGAPYRDCWDTKGPLTHYTYALAQAVFGINLSGPVILSSIYAALTAIVLWRATRQWFGEAIAWSAGLAYGWLVVAIPFNMNAQSEGFANLFIALGLWGAMRGLERNSAGRLIGAGVALAIAVLYKYTITLPVLALTLGVMTLPLFRNLESQPRPRILRWALYVFAGALATLLAFVLFLAARGALTYAAEHVIFMLTEFPKVTVNPALLLLPGESGPPWFYWQRTLEQWLRLPVFYLLAGSGCALAIWRRREWGWPITLWLAAALVSVYPQKVLTLYHWTLALPALALGAGAFAWEVRARRWALAAIAVAVAANIGYRLYSDQWQIVGPALTGQQTRAEFFASQAVQDEIEVADYLRDHTTPDDLIWVWGNHSVIYYWADRRSPTRFIFNSPLMAAIDDSAFQPRWKDEVLAALYAHPPTYIVITWYDRTWFDFQNPVDQFAAIPGYQEFLDRYYRRETFMSRFAIHRLTPWWSRLNSPDLLDSVTAVDLLKELPRAELAPAPNQPIEPHTFELPGERPYPALLIHPEGRATFNLTVPKGKACFRADLALDPQSWGWGGDGASFMLAVNNEKVFEQTVGNTEADRRWHPAIVDLSKWAGQTIALTLATGPGPNSDFTGDLAGWGQPRLVVSPDPGAPSCETNVVQKPAP